MPTTTKKAPPSEYVHRFEKWKATGPLYRYRQTSGMTMGGAASALGVSIGTIQNLEDGNRSPVGKFYFRKLCELFQARSTEVEKLWARWLGRKPAP
jgi:DNA-binding XRE family transcriptional regulator